MVQTIGLLLDINIFSNGFSIVFGEGEVNTNINNVHWTYGSAFTSAPKTVCSTTILSAYRIVSVNTVGANIEVSSTPTGKWYYRAIAVGY